VKHPQLSRRLLALTLCCVFFPLRADVPAEPTPPPAPPKAIPEARRPVKLALVLSGGGARGAAHVGVLKVLEELRVPVDLVVGTSVGAITGGLYATGWSPEDLEALLRETDFTQLFSDRVERQDKTFRRKQDDVKFFIGTKLRFQGWVPYLPSSILSGQRMSLFFQTLEIQSTGEKDFDQFPIPFRAIAADLATGDAVIIDHGSLGTALRASMSVTGLFPPVDYDGRKLIDGGAAANFPIGIAQDLGAESVIAVDITSAIDTGQEAESLMSILDNLTTFITARNYGVDRARLRPTDVLVKPEIPDIGFAGFDKVKQAIAAGEAAARSVSDQLKRFSVGEEEYARYKARLRRRDPDETVVQRISLDNTSWVEDRLILKRLPYPSREPLDRAKFQEDIMGLYGLEYFGVIKPELEKQENDQVLILHTPLKPYGRNSLQFGLSLRDDFAGESTYTFSVRYLLLAANRRGGEWENVGQIGTLSLLETQFYQPLDTAMRWFVVPSGAVRRENRTAWVDGEEVGEFRTDTKRGLLEFGRTFGDWGEVRAGGYAQSEEGTTRSGTSTAPDYEERSHGALLSFHIDTLDTPVFPREGWEVLARFTDSRIPQADESRRQSLLRGGTALSFGRNTLAPGVEAGWTSGAEVTPGSAFRLGGIGRLSGLHHDELLGEKYGLARLLYYRELTRLDLGALSNRVYCGASIETGNVYGPLDPVTSGSLRHSGSVFLGAQTVVGPAYLGVGFADGGEHLLYFLIGERF
jgi:NTE family protein